MRVDRMLVGLLVLWLTGTGFAIPGRATDAPGGGESNPFAALRADASTNLFTGSASVTVPILLPPGRKLATPELALRYSSHGGLSFVGFGWSLSLGVLARQVEHGTPGCVGPDPEAFRLTLASSSNELVQAGGSDDRFALEFDEGWAEAMPDRVGNRWTVRTRDGLAYEFGGAEAARVHSGGDAFYDPIGCAFTTAWYVTRLEDPSGNRIEIEWEKAGNTPLPARVLYGGNADAGIPHPFRIRFESEALGSVGRPILRTLASGVDQRLERRIRRILVEARATRDGEFEEIRRYELGYDDSLPTADFLLKEVAGTDLPTRRFRYSTSIPTVVEEFSEPVPDPEILAGNRETGPFLAMMDLNGDGFLDRLCVDGSGRWHAAYGEAGPVQLTGEAGCSGPGNWRRPSLPNLVMDRISKSADGEDVYSTLDLDGDALPDLVVRRPSGVIHVHRGECQTARDCGFASAYEVWNNPYPASDPVLRRTSNGNRGTQLNRDLIDLDGDARPDLVRARLTGNWEVYRNTGAGFETVPRVIAAIDDVITYSPRDDANSPEERQLIDVNDDGLVDWVRGVVHANPIEASDRMPELYYGVGPAGQLTGPFPRVGGPYLCPPTDPDAGASLCTGSNALPAGWAIVGAATVRLNTGFGFSEPIHSPAPFWWNAHETANRLRGSWSSTSPRETNVFRDFVDVNGDGRVDWVSTGYPYDQSLDWFVLYNQGDGRFGGGLAVLAPASKTSRGISLGRVRPAATIPDVSVYLGRSFHHVSPDDRSDRQMMLIDVDADGLPEKVRAFGLAGGDRWALDRLRYLDAETPHQRPLLLTRVDDGVGGVTHFRYAPSSRFVAPSGEVARLPFVTWLVTGVRRTDGLCDTPPEDWFSLAGNPCLAAGHELVQRIEYEGGVYDGLAREFLGFAKTRVFDGPAGIGSLKEIEFHQSRALKGKVLSESVLVGGVDLLARTRFDWQTVSDGPRTQIFLREQRAEEWPLYAPAGQYAGQCSVHRNSIFGPDGTADPMTRIRSTCSMACAGAGSSASMCTVPVPGMKQIDTVWAEPAPGADHPIWDRPAEIVTSALDASGLRTTIARVRHHYDDLARGFVDRGHPTIELSLVSESPLRWAWKLFGYDQGSEVGPGNVTSIHVPVDGSMRLPTQILFDPEFSLHPIREAAWVSNVGASAERRIERRFDLRSGQPVESVGLHGRAAGDLAGTQYDSLGRKTCEYAPGTSCGSGSGFTASVEYRYVYGTAGAAAPLDRLSFVEVRRREPGAPGGYLTTRSHFDALGRERITTNQQQAVDPAKPGTRPSLSTVVVRQLEYGPNGLPVRVRAPWLAADGRVALEAPEGTASALTSYVLNGNPAGRLDPAGRVFESTGFDGGRSRTLHLGRTRLRIDGIEPSGVGGDQTVEVLDEHGRVVERRSLAAGGQELARWNAEYDGRNRVVAEWFGGSSSTRIERRFDLLGRPIETRDPDAGSWRVGWDEAGNEVFRDDPEPDRSIQSCYDGLNRVVLQCARESDLPDPGLCSASAPTCTLAYRYRYDEATPVAGTANFGLGQLTSVEGPDSRHRFAYDLRGRVAVELDVIQGRAAVTRYAYRPDLDRLDSMTYPDGEIVSYGYDASGQPAWLSQVDEEGNPLADYVRAIRYDLRGRPVSIERGNLTTDRFDYHGASEGFALARIQTTVPGTRVVDRYTVLVDLAYRDYDVRGRLRRTEDLRDHTGALSMTASYAYDGLGRLTASVAATPELFAYDSIGNLRSQSGIPLEQSGAVPLGPHQFDRMGRASGVHWTFAYDASGRRISKRLSDGSIDQRYVWDAFGALRETTRNGVDTTLGYDHDGRRVFETRGGVTRRFYGRHAEQVDDRLVKYYFVGDRLIATRSDPVASGAGTAGLRGARGAGQLGRDAVGWLVVTPPVRIALILAGAVLVLLPLGHARPALGLRVAPSGAFGGSLLVLAVSLPVVVPSLGCAGQNSIRHYHLNHLGSPIAITGPGGGIEHQYRYSAYGRVARFDGRDRATSAHETSRREFGGYEADDESGLQYAGSRYYDPATASFLSPDPADEHASPYAFVGWDPINAVDPDGAAIGLVAAILLAVSAVLVVASAIVAGVQSGRVGVGFQALGIGLATMAAGYVVGLAAPAAASASLISQSTAQTINASLAVAAIGASAYGVASADGTASVVLAGAGLALSLAGAAYSIGGLVRTRGGAAPVSSSGADGTDGSGAAGGVVQVRTPSPRVLQQLALEAQQRLTQLAQYTALERVKTAIGEIRARYLGRTGIDVYADVLIEGARIPHPTRLFGQHLLPNRVEVAPVVVPTGRAPVPAMLAPVPWDRFRIHEIVPVLRDGAVPKTR